MEKKKKEYVRIIVLAICSFLLLVSAIFSSPISFGLRSLMYKTGIKICDNELVVHFVDVGQGDASVITFPNGQTMMIDAGPKAGENELVEYIKDNVESTSYNHTIDYLILTHPDTDHSGGMCAIFKQFDITTFYRPNIASKRENDIQFVAKCDVKEYDEVISVSKEEDGLKTNIINQNYNFNVGGVKVEIFAPLRVYLTTNSMSPIIKISYLDKSFLFAGDIQKDAEQDMLDVYSNQLDADVLKVAHHGSNTSNSNQFIAQVSPIYAIISAEDPNSYGHPSYETVVTLQRHNALVIKTANNMIRFSLGDDGLKLLDSDTVISRTFVEWKVIAIILATVLIIIQVILVIKLIRFNNRIIVGK